MIDLSSVSPVVPIALTVGLGTFTWVADRWMRRLIDRQERRQSDTTPITLMVVTGVKVERR